MLKMPVPAVRWTAPSLIRGSVNSLLVSARIPPTGGRVHPKLGKQGIKGANTFNLFNQAGNYGSLLSPFNGVIDYARARVCVPTQQAFSHGHWMYCRLNIEHTCRCILHTYYLRMYTVFSVHAYMRRLS